MKRLNDEERIWRVNYYYRAAYSVIPRRRGVTDGSAEWMLIQAYEFFDPIRKKYYYSCIENFLNLETGLVESKMLREYNAPRSEKEEWLIWLPEEVKPVHIYNPCYPHVKELLQQTELNQPPSERALPRPVPMDQINIDRWLKRCPSYMDSYKDQLVKLKIQA